MWIVRMCEYNPHILYFLVNDTRTHKWLNYCETVNVPFRTYCKYLETWQIYYTEHLKRWSSRQVPCPWTIKQPQSSSETVSRNCVRTVIYRRELHQSKQHPHSLRRTFNHSKESNPDANLQPKWQIQNYTPTYYSHPKSAIWKILESPTYW